ncbi:putative TOS1-like glycosyl hydrolase-domain-containing protein [Calycina marina]|uniref:glucan endo-1,3-beta-D-glucosidase n=1 Tax=Calycina marina TaxID=1763456 RepID=A0A9P7Z9K1_9HELO|nr:putative TOS1-like glycosyl hydrolase-domain-containing protein [Calycina marina]
MKLHTHILTLIILVLSFAAFCLSISVRADQCLHGSEEIGGNHYCQAVEAFRYTNVGTDGTYQRVVNMGSDGACDKDPQQFSGPLSPLNEEVSLHFRGPIELKQIAVYTPVSASDGDTAHHHRHHDVLESRHGGHNIHDRGNADSTVTIVDIVTETTCVTESSSEPADARSTDPAAIDKAATPVMVTATIDGQVVSWVNDWFGSSQTAPADVHTSATAHLANEATKTPADLPVNSPPSPPTDSATDSLAVLLQSRPVATLHSAAAATTSIDQSTPAGMGLQLKQVNKLESLNAPTFQRSGYYSAEQQVSDGLVFLSNFGGAGSGVWDLAFGSSLSYVNNQGTACSKIPQILADVLVPSGHEFAIMTNKSCFDNDCGYVRPGSIAYHGFDGADKLFLMEFSMPNDTSTFEAVRNNIPAIWLLNAQIPRTQQYGKCSCWDSGCGEFDIIEAVGTEPFKLKSTLHSNTPGGDSDFVQRPTDGYMKLAVIFSSQTSTIHVQVIPNDIVFGETISGDYLDSISRSVEVLNLSVFDIVTVNRAHCISVLVLT